MMPNSWYRTDTGGFDGDGSSTRPEDFHCHKNQTGHGRSCLCWLFFLESGEKMDVNFHRLITNIMHHN